MSVSLGGPRRVGAENPVFQIFEMIFQRDQFPARLVDRQPAGLLINASPSSNRIDYRDFLPLVLLSSGRGQHCPAELLFEIGDLQFVTRAFTRFDQTSGAKFRVAGL
jgi:hypothetical protein